MLHRLAAGEAIPRKAQPAEGATYARKIDKSEAAIDWNAPAATIDRQIRAFDPAPGAHTVLAGQIVKVWRAKPDPHRASDLPGTLVEATAAGIVVACGDGSLRLVELQPAGGRRMSAAAYVAGRRLARGARFGAGAA